MGFMTVFQVVVATVWVLACVVSIGFVLYDIGRAVHTMIWG
jgi:hypothetical protein